MYTGKCNRRRRIGGISLIETLAAIAILTIGIASVIGGMGALARTEAHARQMELMTSLAQHKYEELAATSTNLTSSQNGDFTDQNNSDYQWSADIDQTQESNLTYITVTVTPTNTTNTASAKVTGLIYYNQSGTTTNSTTAATGGGGANGGGARGGG